MKKVSYWNKSIALLSVLTIALGGQMNAIAALRVNFNLNSQAIALQDGNAIAQSTENLCRLVDTQEGLAVRQRPDPNSPRVGGLGYKSQVTIAAGDTGVLGVPGPDGRFWVEITYPFRGYISKGFPNGPSNLLRCSGNSSGNPQPTPPATNLCRQIESRVAPRGIAVRADASRFSDYRGGVPANGKVTLIPNYRLVLDKSGENRNWVEISYPVRGFISASNLIMCR